MKKFMLAGLIVVLFCGCAGMRTMEAGLSAKKAKALGQGSVEDGDVGYKSDMCFSFLMWGFCKEE